MAADFLIGITMLAGLAAIYSVLAWNAAARFGHKVLLVTWPTASVLLLAYYYLMVLPPALGFFTAEIYANAVFAIFLAFGLATLSVRRRLRQVRSSHDLSFSHVARAAGAFFVGLILGLIPILVLDIVTLVRRP